MDTQPLSPAVFQILVSLSDRQMHGYAILGDIARRTDGEVELTASTLYSAVKRLTELGWIRETDERPVPELDDQRRRYFTITPGGRRVLEREVARLERLLAGAREKGLAT